MNIQLLIFILLCLSGALQAGSSMIEVNYFQHPRTKQEIALFYATHASEVATERCQAKSLANAIKKEKKPFVYLVEKPAYLTGNSLGYTPMTLFDTPPLKYCSIDLEIRRIAVGVLHLLKLDQHELLYNDLTITCGNYKYNIRDVTFADIIKEYVDTKELLKKNIAPEYAEIVAESFAQLEESFDCFKKFIEYEVSPTYAVWEYIYRTRKAGEGQKLELFDTLVQQISQNFIELYSFQTITNIKEDHSIAIFMGAIHSLNLSSFLLQNNYLLKKAEGAYGTANVKPLKRLTLKPNKKFCSCCTIS